jgi:hypothetical protein
MDDFIEKAETVVLSQTFKESRKMYRLRMVPDRIEAVNLRIYNKSDFVTDVFLRELEGKLNTEIESIAREKYFQGTLKGLDYSIVDKFERLKKDENDDLRPADVLVEEAKQKYLEDKHSSAKRIGSFLARENSEFKKEIESEKLKTVQEMSKQWIDETELDTGLPDLTTKRQEIVDKKGVAITDITPAKYTKEHVAAAIFYFINFTMPVIKRKELLESHILANEEDFDEVIKGLITAFQQNYSTFEASHQPPDFLKEETDLEKHYKYTEKKNMSKKERIKEEEERKRFLR